MNGKVICKTEPREAPPLAESGAVTGADEVHPGAGPVNCRLRPGFSRTRNAGVNGMVCVRKEAYTLREGSNPFKRVEPRIDFVSCMGTEFLFFYLGMFRDDAFAAQIAAERERNFYLIF